MDGKQRPCRVFFVCLCTSLAMCLFRSRNIHVAAVTFRPVPLTYTEASAADKRQRRCSGRLRMVKQEASIRQPLVEFFDARLVKKGRADGVWRVLFSTHPGQQLYVCAPYRLAHTLTCTALDLGWQCGQLATFCLPSKVFLIWSVWLSFI